MPVAVIADIVGSRRLPDRARAQRAIDDAIARVERDHPAARELLGATTGDEFQGIYDVLAAALSATLLVQLALPDGVELRFGIGVGEVQTLDGAAGEIPEGPGWWAARKAIDTVHAQQQRAVPSARTRVERAPGEAEVSATEVDLANAYLLARDELIGAMSARARRLTYGRCLGHTQSALADDEGVSQSAVSQVLAGAGAAAVVTGFEALRGDQT